ncbi:carboxypeptidase regulatory-like domain-containing protein [bacterium]|nr:carboxypeptidase regulatory-like domain-containing protein [bacterium]
MPRRSPLRHGALLLLLVGQVGCAPHVAGVGTDGLEGFSGQVIGLDGKPAAGVTVRGYLVSNNAANLVSNNAATYRIAASNGLEARSDAQGHFKLEASKGAALNVEAILSDNVKALRLNVGAGASDLRLMLARTGQITGRVTAPSRPEVTNLEGAEVFIPGLPYQVRTTQAGSYALLNVPVGTFELVAKKDGLGSARRSGVQVQSEATTQADDLALSTEMPTISAVQPAHAAPGEVVTLTGEHFGTSSGAPLRVDFSAAPATAIERVDDRTLKVTVPAGAVTGDLSITVGGVQSAGVPFTVLASLTLGFGNTFLAVGEERALGLSVRDTGNKVVANPQVRWTVQGEAIALENGKLKALKTGTATLRAESGRLAIARTVRVLARHPEVSTLAGGFNDPWDPLDDYLDGLGTAARFYRPIGLAFDALGNLLVADLKNQRIRQIASGGMVSTLAGDGTRARLDGKGLLAQFHDPSRFAVAGSDTYVSENGHAIRKIDADGNVTTIAGNGEAGYLDGKGTAARFNFPVGIARDANGNLFVADALNHAIRKIDASGNVTTYAGMGTASGSVDGTLSTARFYEPAGLAFDPQGNLYVADAGNHKIRKITPNGTVSTLAGSGEAGYSDETGPAAKFNGPMDLVMDTQGWLLVADQSNHLIRAIAPNGAVATYAGMGAGYFDAEAPSARFYGPNSLALDGAGNLYVSDSGNDRIRKIRP